MSELLETSGPGRVLEALQCGDSEHPVLLVNRNAAGNWISVVDQLQRIMHQSIGQAGCLAGCIENVHDDVPAVDVKNALWGLRDQLATASSLVSWMHEVARAAGIHKKGEEQ